MEKTKTCYEHIFVDPRGEAYIFGTSMRISQLIAEKKAYGWSAEELHFQHPYLTLGQIYAALAYYADHTETIGKQIEKELIEFDQLKRKSPKPEFIRSKK